MRYFPNTTWSVAMKPVRQRGFTLIELMVVVVIVAILAGVVYPSYTQYVMRARRADGQSGLMQLQGQEEKFFTQCGVYTTSIDTGTISGCTGLGYPAAKSPDLNYNLSISTLAADKLSYTATAQPQGAQANDSDCLNLTLKSTGDKGQSGPNTQGKCWQK